MISRDGKYYQRRWQTGFDGKETNVDEKQVDFVVGSGNHARTYLHLTENRQHALQVLPLSWYSEKGGYWDMSPGYDQPDYPGSDARRCTTSACSATTRIPKFQRPCEHAASAEMAFAEPIPEGIDCQRCHGPGQRHVELASAGGTPDQIRAAIVNPKRLRAGSGNRSVSAMPLGDHQPGSASLHPPLRSRSVFLCTRGASGRFQPGVRSLWRNAGGPLGDRASRVPAARIAVLSPKQRGAPLHHLSRSTRHSARTIGGRAL